MVKNYLNIYIYYISHRKKDRKYSYQGCLLCKMNGFIYLVQIKEFVNNNEEIYKVGTICEDNPIAKIVQRYPQGSEIQFGLSVKNYKLSKEKAISIFTQNYEQMKQYGDEYFKGDIFSMREDLMVIINTNDRNVYEGEVVMRRI